jgi:hypothetical protein
MGSLLRPPASDHRFAPPLRPPRRDAVPSPGPGRWSTLDLTRGADVIVGLEVADSFELIWPTGETDEQCLGGQLSEEPSSDPALIDAPLPVDAGSASDDVVLAIQRAIGPDRVAIDRPSLLPRLPARTTQATVPAARRSVFKRLIGGLRRRSR